MINRQRVKAKGKNETIPGSQIMVIINHPLLLWSVSINKMNASLRACLPRADAEAKAQASGKASGDARPAGRSPRNFLINHIPRGVLVSN
jgi:hypothetical protein